MSGPAPVFPYGHFFVPELDDRVWVAFENGNPSKPVWLGIWYPQGTVPPQADVSPPTTRLIRSHKGHVLIFDDLANEVAIQYGEEKKGKILLSADKLELSFGKNSIVLNDDGIVLKRGESSLSLTESGIALKGNRIDLN